MEHPKYPSLYQVNTRVWLTELSGELGRPATLDDIPDSALDQLADLGFDWLWFLSVWTTGPVAREISRENPVWRRDFRETLPDLTEEDIAGSGFAIAGYEVHPGMGGNPALERLRARLRKRGLKLMLDFVPNHMGPDHPWVSEHPEYFVRGSESDLLNFPENYTHIRRKGNDIVLAFGRDPYFSGWPDTLQLDYSNPDTVKAMTGEFLRIAGMCDGVRCDMAMLILPEVFERTWGKRAQPFWPDAIRLVRGKVPGFCFMAEVYWDMEWDMMEQGFDYAYDKRLYDRLLEGHATPVREHLFAGLDYQDKLARFLENHDEPRAAATFGANYKAAAVITFMTPGLRFFHQGQFEGKQKRISPHLVRGPLEPVNQELQMFYMELLSILKRPVFREGTWELLNCVRTWDSSFTSEEFLAFAWEGAGGKRMLIIINYSPTTAQCFVHLPYSQMGGLMFRFSDLMSPAVYDREGDDLACRGMFFDMPAWGYHVFEVERQ